MVESHKVEELLLKKDSVEYTESLLALMAERLSLLHALEAIGASQTEAAENPDVSVLIQLLSRKETLLESLASNLRKLEVYQSDDPDQRVWKSVERRRECRQLAEQGNQLLAKLVTHDQATLQRVNDRRNAIATQLQDGRDSVLAQSAYTAGHMLNDGQLDIPDA